MHKGERELITNEELRIRGSVLPLLRESDFPKSDISANEIFLSLADPTQNFLLIQPVAIMAEDPGGVTCL